jgi:hypothetical protein
MWIGIVLNFVADPDPDLDRHSNGKSDQDPNWHQNDAYLQHLNFER